MATDPKNTRTDRGTDGRQPHTPTSSATAEEVEETEADSEPDTLPEGQVHKRLQRTASGTNMQAIKVLDLLKKKSNPPHG
jgi:hypothetical protein